jgi:hypothetical protein
LRELFEDVEGQTLVGVDRFLYGPDCVRFGEEDGSHLADGLTVLYFETSRLALEPNVERCTVSVSEWDGQKWGGSYSYRDVSDTPFWKRFTGNSLETVIDPDRELMNGQSEYVVSFEMSGGEQFSAHLDMEDDRLYFD